MHRSCLPVFVLACLAVPAVAQWRQANPAASPGTRSGASLCYDYNSNRAILFGGNAGFSVSNQTWAYDGTTWTQLAPLASPTGTVGAELVSDPVRGVVVLYGGLNTSWIGGASADTTWEFDGTTWTQIFPVTTPGGLGNYGACYDIVRQRMVVYGGTADSFFPIAQADTWEYDGTNWIHRTPTVSPGPLERPAMCFHTGLGKTVLFGGIDPQVGGVDTTWAYDGTNWTALTVSGPRPAPRTAARMVYDSARGVCVMSGGLDPMTGAPFAETWEFDGAAWTLVPTAPTGRFMSTMAYLPTPRLVVLYGGLDPVTYADLGDTWIYGAGARTFGAGCAGSAGVPALAAVDAPRLGQNFSLQLTNLAPASPFALLTIGFSDQVSVLGALPAPLAGFGMPGCSAFTSAEAVVLVGASAGASTWTVAMPNDAGFVGLVLFYQGLSLDPAANAAGAAVSNALEGIVGR